MSAHHRFLSRPGMALRDPGRRSLLRGLSAGGLSLAAAPWMAPLQALAADAAPAGDYKALVCLFLFGGNDANNLIVPTDAAPYATYRAARGPLALAADRLLPISPGNTPGRAFGLHPAFTGLAKLFQAGQASVVANVGPLVVPTTRAQYQARSVPLPNALFSHSDQQSAWQSAVSSSVGRSGWGGRLLERLVAPGAASRGFAALSLAGGNLWEGGDQGLLPYKLAASGDFGLDFYDAAGTDPLSVAVRDMLADSRPHLFEQAWLDVMARAIEVQKVLTGALAGVKLATVFPDTGLGRQLGLAARLMAARAALGLPRQTFFASLGGFDTHGDEQLQRQQALFAEMDGAISAFHAATLELGLADKACLFTASDFGRTLQSNGQGSDHGWGSHQLVVGGGLAGGRLHGTFPDLTLGGPDDTGSGRWIPTTSVEQFGAGLGRWLGASDAQLAEVFPALAAFPGALPLTA